MDYYRIVWKYCIYLSGFSLYIEIKFIIQTILIIMKSNQLILLYIYVSHLNSIFLLILFKMLTIPFICLYFCTF